MKGVFLEKVSNDGSTFWVAKDEATPMVISIGNTPSEAVEAYEVIIENEMISKQLGVSLEDMDI